MLWTIIRSYLKIMFNFIFLDIILDSSLKIIRNTYYITLQLGLYISCELIFKMKCRCNIRHYNKLAFRLYNTTQIPTKFIEDFFVSCLSFDPYCCQFRYDMSQSDGSRITCMYTPVSPSRLKHINSIICPFSILLGIRELHQTRICRFRETFSAQY